jgi:DNA-binding Lrp family transcriptional regulator
MQKSKFTFACLSVFCLAAAVCAPLLAAAQSKSPIYTYVAFWDVPRAQWPEVNKSMPAEKATMEKLVANGTIVGFGAFESILHQEGAPTHGTWFTASSEGNILKALEAVYAQPALINGSFQTSSKHSDQLFTGDVYAAKAGTMTNGYMTVSRWQFKPGTMKSFAEQTNKFIVPVLDKLIADGTLNSYGELTEDYHSQGMGVLYEYFSVPDAASMDKVDKALEDVIAANPSIGEALRNDTDPMSHRDYLYRVGLSESK